MKIKMLVSIGGSCDGQKTARGAVIDIGANSALDYIRRGFAVAVADEPETAVVEPEAEVVRTADVVPPRNAAKRSYRKTK